MTDERGITLLFYESLYRERQLPDGRWLFVHPLLTGTARLMVSNPSDTRPDCYERAY